MFEIFDIKSNIEHQGDSLDLVEALRQEKEKNAELEAVLDQVGDVLSRLRKGDLEARITGWDMFASYRSVACDLNHFVDLADAYIRETGAALVAASEGRFYRKFQPAGMMGSFADGAKLVNRITENVADLKAQQLEQRLEIAALFEKDIMNVIDILSNAADKVDITSETLTNHANENLEQSTKVAAAAEQASVSVKSISLSADNLFTTFADITERVSVSSERAHNAAKQAREVMSAVESLKEESKAIGQIVQAITEIAGQTNLLALNATIEAARAGDAGKGFSVVASEVKSLAQQTAGSTKDITEQVNSSQAKTEDTVVLVNDITDRIHAFNEFAAAVAATALEQETATEAISKNIREAAQGANEVSDSILKVSEASLNTRDNALELKSAAAALRQSIISMKVKSSDFLDFARSA